ncbi:DUF397 domain-containing protein [Streptomyces tagetis]|uniref:DUF397 domain-containing protein n=1 Tax=Streptomyces tagetis TaxID=2820809 RepID=A0A940XKJ0_9ACTN|nr:DUF397 domain-containing protein [Streptomyces sp. RG38]MBQ0830074.1 DUF397 domain-containing protein [Streptomyces sp. RG38]
MNHVPVPRPPVTALTWFRSSYSSSGDGHDCVEVAVTATSVHLRDSKHPDGPHLAVTRDAWAGFVGDRRP